MESTFVIKVNAIIESNLEDEKFGVNELADACHLSRSQLHRKLGELTGKSTTQYIREYRLEKALKMLKNNEATASEIAYKVGFNSPTYFNSSFSKYFGYTPGEYRVRSSLETESEVENTETPSKISKSKILTFSIVGLLVVLGVIFWQSSTTIEPETLDPIEVIATPTNDNVSIMVSVFKNLSSDPQNQYFADGIREDIISQLSKLEGVIIKSDQLPKSNLNVGSSNQSNPIKIEVDYVLNGSVQKFEDDIKVNIQLFDSNTNSLVWTSGFENKFEDIFELEKEISRQIASELDLVLGPDEIQRLEKTPTDNIEAYNLYLQGKYKMFQFKQPDFDEAIQLFYECINMDPNFALGYVGLSEWVLYNFFPNVPEAEFLRAREYINKALSIDENISDAQRVLGVISMEYEWNWNKAETAFKKALELDSNNLYAYINYAKFLRSIKGDFDSALYYLEESLKRNPVSYHAYVLSAETYFMKKDYDTAIKLAEKVLDSSDLGSWKMWAYWIQFLAYAEIGEDDKAVDLLTKSWELGIDSSYNIAPMKEAYKKSGIDGVFQFIVDLDTKNALLARNYQNAYLIAQKLAYLGKFEDAMQWIEKAYERKNSDLYQIKNDPLFNKMHNYKPFLDLLDKMGLGGYPIPIKP
ncbi:helix-turn-helix domain-containing protein [Aegicerativicinus sediminis]|uniref:helix-turn-helix domain-containing protein n=1 Tax=Aegicerativicinus sediminis TaxID=2893202 RepID=UPI001E54CABA|nr:helix-turn-helix domain-containing protein [Aegicerativicinus sediminis]